MMQADMAQFLQENPNASFEDFLASPRGLEWLDKKASSADPIAFALKQADMLKDLGEGIAKGVEGLAGQVGKTLEKKKEEEEEEEKEKEKLDKAVARNIRERKARKIAKKYAALATYGVGRLNLGLSGEDISTSGEQLRKLLQWRPKKKKKKRSGKDYEQELNLQEQRTIDKLLFEEERHNNLMEELELRQMLAKTGGILPEEGPIANVLTAVGVKKSKRKKEEEAERRKAQRAAQVASDAAKNVKMGALLAKKVLEFNKAANQAAPQQSYANTQPSPTAQRQGAHNAMNAQAAGAGSQQPPLTPEQQQVLAQRPQATPGANQRPLNPTVANLGAGPLTGDQFGPGAQSGLGMALTASARSHGDLIDMALRCIEKRAWSKEREALEEWQMTAKEDDPDIDEKRRRLKELQDADAKGKDHVKLSETSLLPGPVDLAGTAIAGGIGGAGIGALINAIRGRNLKRGLITGGLTGAGTLSGHELGSNLSRNRAAEFVGGWGGTGFGGYGGYQLAQHLQGPEEEEKKKKKRAKKASADPLEFVLSITKSSATATRAKQRRKGAPRSVTIKKPSRVCPDTGKVTPGSSSIKHIARTGKKIK